MDKKSRREILYFGAIHFLLTSMMSFWSYSTNYFREIGFTGAQIGNMNAVGTFFAMLLLPLTGIISDKIRSPRKTLFFLAACMLPANILLAFGGHLALPVWVFTLLCTVIVSARQSANSMMESWAGGEVTRLGYSFGSVRRYGSFGYICISVIGVVLFGKLLPTWTCLLFSAGFSFPLLYLIASHRGDAYSEAPVVKEKREKTGNLIKLVFCNYYFATYLLLVMAFDLFLGIVNLDMSYLMDYVGADPSALGWVGGVRAGTEIVVMILISRQKKLPPLWIMLVASGILIALEHLLYTAASNVLHICLITVFCSGLSGGMFYGIGNNYVFKIVDRRAASTAMAVLGVAKSLSGVIGNSVGGKVIDQFGVTSLTTAVGIVSLVLTAGFLFCCVLGRLVWKKPYISEQP